jgi:hypothetical protein
MKTHHRWLPIGLFAAFAASCLFGTSQARAAFPARGDSATQSIGTIVFVINPLFQGVLAAAAYPGYDTGTKRWTSALLIDGATKIGLSDPLVAGSPQDSAGVPVGSAGTVVSDSSFSLLPAGFGPAARTREVHMQYLFLNLCTQGPGPMLRAGSNAPSQPSSFGAARSLSSSGDPAVDFPATAFFDLNGEFDFPPYSSLRATAPILLQSTSFTDFSRAIFTTRSGPAVPVIAESDVPSIGMHAGDLFGFVLIVAQGVGFSVSSSNDVAQLQAAMSQLRELPVPAQYQSWAPNLGATAPVTPALPAWGLALMTAGLLAAGVAVSRVRLPRARPREHAAPGLP